jgi:hypothetical protein
VGEVKFELQTKGNAQTSRDEQHVSPTVVSKPDGVGPMIIPMIILEAIKCVSLLEIPTFAA